MLREENIWLRLHTCSFTDWAIKMTRLNGIPREVVLITVFTLITAYFIGAITTQRMPYVRTEVSFYIRYFVLFPVLAGGFISLCLFKRIKSSNGRTAFELTCHEQSALGRFFHLLLFIVLSLAFFWLIAWSTISVPGVAARFFANKLYTGAYEVQGWTVRAKGPGYYFDVKLREVGSGESSYLSIPSHGFARGERHEIEQHIAPKTVLCMAGRTSSFGTIIEEIGDCAGRRILIN